MTEPFERRESLRRYATVKVTPPDGGETIDAKGVVSLRGIFLEGAQAIPAAWTNAYVGVETDLGGAAPLKAVCLVAPPPTDRPQAGHLLTWKTLDFENERELARYLDEEATKP